MRRACCVVIAVAGIACGDKDTEVCRTFRAELGGAVADADALQQALDAAVREPATTTDAPCEAEGLNPRRYMVVSAKGGAGKVPAAEGVRSTAFRAEHCKILPLPEQQSALDDFRESAKGLSSGYQLLFIEGERVKAELVDATTYKKGELSGRVLLWSHEKRSIVCAADAKAESSDKVHTVKGRPGSGQKTLDSHLTFLTVAAGVEVLKKVED